MADFVFEGMGPFGPNERQVLKPSFELPGGGGRPGYTAILGE